MEKKRSKMNWQTILPEHSNEEVLHAFGCDFIPVLVTGRFQTDGALLVDKVNRMKRIKTGYPEIDKSDALRVPLDGQWHWQSQMVDIVAWSALPTKEDPRWIPCNSKLPENDPELSPYVSMSLHAISVMALCEISKDSFAVRLVNRLNIKPTGNPYLDQMATDGWTWSDTAVNVRAWMPFPKPADKT